MADSEREALVNAGQEAMQAFLSEQSVLEVAASEFAPGDAEITLANKVAATLPRG